MKNSIKLLKVICILLTIQIVWFVFNLENLIETTGFINSSIPYLITGIIGMIILIVIGLLKDKNNRIN